MNFQGPIRCLVAAQDPGITGRILAQLCWEINAATVGCMLESPLKLIFQL